MLMGEINLLMIVHLVPDYGVDKWHFQMKNRTLSFGINLQKYANKIEKYCIYS